MEKRTIIIVEIGENHLGDVELAKEMVKEAAASGADIIKFQSYNSETFKKDDPEYDWFNRVSLSDEDHFMLKQAVEENGAEFMSAPFNMERAKFLCEGLKTPKVKVASGKMTDLRLLSYLNQNCEEVFLSTGMALISEIRESLAVLNKVKVCLLHCVTQYPLKDCDANLLAIETLRKEFPDTSIGYSDHTIGIIAPLIAVALGAKVIEKHFTIDKNMEGTDHILSVIPRELNNMVNNIRTVEDLLGDGLKEPQECEKEIKEFVRGRFLG